jgi:hypothetical protein
MSHARRLVAILAVDVAITAKPMQRPPPAYVASFSQPSIKAAGRLRRVAERYHGAGGCHGQPPGRLMCSYFIRPQSTAGSRH